MPIFNKNKKNDDVTESAMTSLEETLDQLGLEIENSKKEGENGGE